MILRCISTRRRRDDLLLHCIHINTSRHIIFIFSRFCCDATESIGRLRLVSCGGTLRVLINNSHQNDKLYVSRVKMSTIAIYSYCSSGIELVSNNLSQSPCVTVYNLVPRIEDFHRKLCLTHSSTTLFWRPTPFPLRTL